MFVDANGKPVSPTGNQEDQDVTTSAATSTAGDENPDSSPEADQEPEDTMGDVIERALAGESQDEDDPDSDDDPGTDGETEDPEGKKPDGEADTSKDPEKQEATEDDEGTDVEPGQRIPYERFKKVIDQRNEQREQLRQTTEQVEQYRQGHEQYRAIESYMKENELRPQDVVEALQIAAAFNRDPAQAAKLLAPKMDMLQRYTGDVLPEDLQQRVSVGELSPEDAKQIVLQRNENARLRQEQERATAQQQQREQAQQTQATQAAMANAANTVQAHLQKTDPDYAKKAPMIEDRVAVLIQHYRPRTAEQAAQIVQRAHQEVSRHLASATSRPQVRPGPSSSQGAGKNTSPSEPESMLEAMERAANLTE